MVSGAPLLSAHVFCLRCMGDDGPLFPIQRLAAGMKQVKHRYVQLPTLHQTLTQFMEHHGFTAEELGYIQSVVMPAWLSKKERPGRLALWMGVCWLQ